MDTNKLTTKSRDAVSAALRNALTNGNPNAEPSHLLHALLMVPGNTVAPLLTAVGADPAVVDAAAQGAIAKLPVGQGSSVSQPSLSGSFARVLADAENRAEQTRRRLRRHRAPADRAGRGRVRRQEDPASTSRSSPTR